MSGPDQSEPPKRLRRASRYNRVQARKAAQRDSDQKFYNGMFTIMGVLALLAILLGAIVMNGAPQVEGMEGWTAPWLFGLTKLEVVGFGFVAFVAFAVWIRMRRKR